MTKSDIIIGFHGYSDRCLVIDRCIIRIRYTYMLIIVRAVKKPMVSSRPTTERVNYERIPPYFSLGFYTV